MAGYRYPHHPAYDPFDPRGRYPRRLPVEQRAAAAVQPDHTPTRAPSAPTPAPAPVAAERLQELTGQVDSLTARVAELEEQLAAERDQVGEQRGKAESYLDLAQRTQADFVNYRRRMERERGDEANRARADVLEQLLPALDDLELALAQMPPDLADHPWAAGLPLVARQLRLALARAGLQRIGTPGESFDPRQHQALGHAPAADDCAPGSIAVVLKPGYSLGERLIRPAQVLVAQEAAAPR